MFFLVVALAQMAAPSHESVTTGDILMRVMMGALTILVAGAVAAAIKQYGAWRELNATIEANEKARAEREEERREEMKRLHAENKEALAIIASQHRDSMTSVVSWQDRHLEWAEDQKARLYQDLVGKAEFQANLAGVHGAIGNVSGQIGEIKSQLAELLRERR
jgi:uncharacterized protein HemX